MVDDVSGEDSNAPSLQARTRAFLNEFFVQGEELVRDLIAENERLRTALSSRGAEPSEDLISRLMRQIEELEAECSEIRRLAGSVQRESGDYRTRLDSLEREHYHLASMYVAGNQFHTAASVEEVLRTITEILLNFVGVGCFTVFAMDEERQVLFPLLREGADLDECAEFSVPSEGPIAATLEQPGPWRVGRPLGNTDEALMHLPLVSGTRLVGVARLERFLPQKQAFAETDFGLLELVSEHSGLGIETAWIRAHAQDMPLGRAALEKLVVS
jgi:hypothetical protein